MNENKFKEICEEKKANIEYNAELTEEELNALIDEIYNALFLREYYSITTEKIKKEVD